MTGCKIKVKIITSFLIYKFTQGEAAVRIRGQKMVSFILAVMVLVGGVCLEVENAHASLYDAACYVNRSNDTHGGAGLAVDTTIEAVPMCNWEMLGIRSRTGLQELAGRYINQKRESFLSLAVVHTDIIASLEEMFFYSLERIPFLVRDSEELVIYYIHQSDGKKKI